MKIIEIFTSLKKDIQFVLITHNKVMMEAADQLFGVTMEEAGISKLLSVKIADIRDDSTIAV